MRPPPIPIESFDILPDRSYYSNDVMPFDFVDVTDSVGY